MENETTDQTHEDICLQISPRHNSGDEITEINDDDLDVIRRLLLPRMPLPTVCRWRLVCAKWNYWLCSPEFWKQWCRTSKWKSCLLFDQTSTGYPVLYDRALNRHFQLRNTLIENLHRTYKYGFRIHDEIVACADGYLCYELKRSHDFLICNPITEGVNFICCIGQGFTFPVKCTFLRVNSLFDADDDCDASFEVITHVPNDNRLLIAFKYLGSPHNSWFYGESFPCDMPNPVSSCAIEGCIYALIQDDRILRCDPVTRQWHIKEYLHLPLQLEWIWLKKTDNIRTDRHRQMSPALFEYEGNMYMMSGFVDEERERGIGIWQVELLRPMRWEIARFPKGIWGQMRKQRYDFAQFGSSFVVFDVKYGCGLAYDIVEKRFYPLPSFQGEAISALKGFHYRPSPQFADYD